MSFTLRFPPHGKWKWNCLCLGWGWRGVRDSGRLWKVPGKCIKFSFVQLRQRLSKLWRRASRSRSLAWPGLVWPWLGCSRHGRLFFYYYNYYDGLLKFLWRRRRRVELSFLGDAAIWISLRCMKLILFGATLSATNYLRQLSADWSYLRLLYAPHFFLPLSLSPSRSLCVSHNKQRQHRLQLGVYVIFV